jgi:hypothetical protein
MDISSGEETACQKDLAPEALEDSLAPVNALVALQDPDQKALEGPARRLMLRSLFKICMSRLLPHRSLAPFRKGLLSLYRLLVFPRKGRACKSRLLLHRLSPPLLKG